MKNICAYITDHTGKEEHIIAANEGAAVGIAAGYYLATGKIPLVYMQNSGLGNAINPLLSLVDKEVYKIPMLFMVGWRGEPGVKDEPQHKKQERLLLLLLDAMQVAYTILDEEEYAALEQIENVIKQVENEGIPHVLIIRKDVFGKYKLRKEIRNDYELSREEALKIVIDHLEEGDIIVSTTGKLSKRIIQYRESLEQGARERFFDCWFHGACVFDCIRDCYSKVERNVFCFDGDGAFIMHGGNR